MKVEKLWGGRFEELPSPKIIDFLSGRDVKGLPPCDERLIAYDLWGNRAHLLMLCRQGIVSKQDGKKLLKGLKDLESLYQQGKFKLDPAKEDVHSNIESFLIERLGIEYGGKIHTGRSRNDQVSLDMRLYLRDQALTYVKELMGLIESLLKKAREHRSTVMPGYTHHQPAMITTFGHLLLSFAEAFTRDVERFIQWFTLFNKNPLGAAAGYGTSFPIDRILTSKLLGFDGPTENVTDPITQRWEPETELAYAICIMMNHLSTLAQTLILLSTSEFKMIHLSDQHSTGSSIMPQKRNPCSLEVIKAKTAFAQGILTSLLSVGKGLFIGYNRETQWTKYWIIDLVEETQPALPVMAEVIRLLQVNKTEMLQKAQRGFLGATPVMEWLVTSFGLPLRKAKMVVEKAVKYSEGEGKESLSFESIRKALKEMGKTLPMKEQDIRAIQSPSWVLSQPLGLGMPSKKRIDEHLQSLKERIRKNRAWFIQKRRQIAKAYDFVERAQREISR